MDDSTKTMVATLASGVLKKFLVTASASAVTHGWISGNQTEAFIAGGMLLASVGWSFWNDYGKAIVMSQLEVLKAKSLASAAKIKDAGLPAVTTADIADQSATLTQKDVTKVIATLPTAVQAGVGAEK